MTRSVEAVLFDLDGTLLDTAPDMVAALNTLRREQGLAPMDYELARGHVSNGTVGLLRIGFAHLDEPARDALRERYLEIYAARGHRGTALFPGMPEVLAGLESAALPWGVVTNKPGFLTEPLLEVLGMRARCACVVSGDTLPRRKPHPDPLLHAAHEVGLPAARAMYVGDAPRDIEAGRAAGMRTVAAVYGYIQPEENPADWGADHVVSHPAEILKLATAPEGL